MSARKCRAADVSSTRESNAPRLSRRKVHEEQRHVVVLVEKSPEWCWSRECCENLAARILFLEQRASSRCRARWKRPCFFPSLLRICSRRYTFLPGEVAQANSSCLFTPVKLQAPNTSLAFARESQSRLAKLANETSAEVFRFAVSQTRCGPLRVLNSFWRASLATSKLEGLAINPGNARLRVHRLLGIQAVPMKRTCEVVWWGDASLPSGTVRSFIHLFY